MLSGLHSMCAGCAIASSTVAVALSERCQVKATPSSIREIMTTHPVYSFLLAQYELDAYSFQQSAAVVIDKTDCSDKHQWMTSVQEALNIQP